MRKKKVHAIAIKSLALLVVLGTALPGEGTGCYDNVYSDNVREDGPVEQFLMADRNAEIALARSAAPESIARDAEVLVLGRRGFSNSGQRKKRFRVYRGARLDVRTGC